MLHFTKYESIVLAIFSAFVIAYTSTNVAVGGNGTNNLNKLYLSIYTGMITGLITLLLMIEYNPIDITMLILFVLSIAYIRNLISQQDYINDEEYIKTLIESNYQIIAFSKFKLNSSNELIREIAKQNIVLHELELNVLKQMFKADLALDVF